MLIARQCSNDRAIKIVMSDKNSNEQKKSNVLNIVHIMDIKPSRRHALCIARLVTNPKR